MNGFPAFKSRKSVRALPYYYLRKCSQAARKFQAAKLINSSVLAARAARSAVINRRPWAVTCQRWVRALCPATAPKPAKKLDRAALSGLTEQPLNHRAAANVPDAHEQNGLHANKGRTVQFPVPTFELQALAHHASTRRFSGRQGHGGQRHGHAAPAQS